jgi:hypothetical protein
MGTDSAVIRWGNFDHTLVLSSAVFEPDDTGRSYRLKPNTRSIWLIGLALRDVLGMFEIPDTPEAIRAGQAVGGLLVPESRQTTNSWGCRGPEPDLSASLRGLVLGDSLMQGLLVGDNDTPPACLERWIRRTSGESVSILNTGVLGYSLEQYYYTLLAYGERFRPHFVIVSICGNDFGDWFRDDNWAEAEYWLDLITGWCRARNLPFLVVPSPGEDMLLAHRNESIYPGRVTAIMRSGGTRYFNPLEAFTNEDLRLRLEAQRAGRTTRNSVLFNRHLLGDNHYSPKGGEFWAEVVLRRLNLVREYELLRQHD